MIIIGKIILVFVLVIAASIIADIIINKLNEGGDSTSMANYIECLKTPIITVHNNNKNRITKFKVHSFRKDRYYVWYYRRNY